MLTWIGILIILLWMILNKNRFIHLSISLNIYNDLIGGCDPEPLVLKDIPKPLFDVVFKHLTFSIICSGFNKALEVYAFLATLYIYYIYKELLFYFNFSSFICLLLLALQDFMNIPSTFSLNLDIIFQIYT